jgi:nucleoside-diphosphate-sugar epimerase
MKMLIIGGRGFIGRNLSEFYQGRYNVLIAPKGKPVEDFLQLKPEYIINCAAEFSESNTIFETNVGLVYKILQYVKENKTTRFIQLGSSSEYGRKTFPIKETDLPVPTTLYEGTKLAATNLCVCFAKEFSLPITILRPFTIYGKYEKSWKLFPTLYRSYKEKSPIFLVEAAHDYLFIDDFLRAVDLFINDESSSGTIINIGSGRQYLNSEVVRIFEEVLDYEFKKTFTLGTKIRSYDSLNWTADITKAQRDFNFSPRISLREGIVKFLEDCEELHLYEEL